LTGELARGDGATLLMSRSGEKIGKSATKSSFAAKCRGVLKIVFASCVGAGSAGLLSTHAAAGGALDYRGPSCGYESAAVNQTDRGHPDLGLVMSVNERLELTLEDGKTLKIAGLDPPRPTPLDPDLDTRSRDKVADWLTGREIRFRLLEGRPDRWGRLTVEAFASSGAPGSPELPVGQAVLEAGLARYEPTAAARPCGAELLAAEASARAGLLGLWADPYYAVIAPEDHGAFAEKTGTSVIVEGVVTGVDNGRFRSVLFLGQRRSRDFSAALSQRAVKLFESAGLKLAALIGQRIRVRGLLDLRFGPQIEIANPDEVEVIKTVQGDGATGTPAGRR
jgi:endonuclease YncB( thermonuclease family)